LGGVMGVLAQSTVCTGNSGFHEITTVPCTPTGSSIVVRFCIFVAITHNDHGGGVYVNAETSVVQIRSDAVFDSTVPAVNNKDGGGVCLSPVALGTSVCDSCGSHCKARSGGLVMVKVNPPSVALSIEFKGLSAANCTGTWGAVGEEAGTQGELSHCNFTCCMGDTTVEGHGAAGLNQGGDGGSETGGEFLLFVGCEEARGCFNADRTGGATLQKCCFVDNAISAITIRQYRSEVLVKLCYFKGAAAVVEFWHVSGSPGGSAYVTVETCLFAGALPAMPTTLVTLAGVQVTATSTRIAFDTASMIPTCGGIAGPTGGCEETRSRANSRTMGGTTGFTATELVTATEGFAATDNVALGVTQNPESAAHRRSGPDPSPSPTPTDAETPMPSEDATPTPDASETRTVGESATGGGLTLGQWLGLGAGLLLALIAAACLG
jgi:hypothetical protein